jgi:hypothetical protein
MPKLTRKTRIRIEILRGEDLLLARDMEVRSHELEPMWESAIKVTRLGLA